MCISFYITENCHTVSEVESEKNGTENLQKGCLQEMWFRGTEGKAAA